MKYSYGYYTELHTYELKWEGNKLGSELEDVQRMIYNPFALAKQEVIFCDSIKTMVIKVTEAVFDVMRVVLNFKDVKMLG